MNKVDELLALIDTDSKTKAKLEKLGIKTYWDILLHVPIRYEDLTSICRIADASVGGVVLVEGDIIHVEVVSSKTKQLRVRISDDDIITLVFFHFYPNYLSQYKVGKKIRAYGEIKLDHNRRKIIIHPKVHMVDNDGITKLPKTFLPVYSTVRGLSQRQIIQLVDVALSKLDLEEILPKTVVDDYNYFSINRALRVLHKLTPDWFRDKHHLRSLTRIKLDEILAQQLIMYNAYLYKHGIPSNPFDIPETYIESIINKLPFKLTSAQLRVIGEICGDLKKPLQMNRLLQGDVGSGKTIVATICLLIAVYNNFQACIIVPTEVLAEQHYNKISNFLKEFKVEIVWLSGSLTQSTKNNIYTKIKTGTAQIIVGTHAILQGKVLFNNLGLIIVDEQHRFGVKQRLTLQEKSSNPHHLMMSATPIPRSLAMGYYADLDVSVIDELPLNRVKIATKLVNNNRRDEVIDFIAKEVNEKRQVYWVCPLIDESEKLELENATKVYQELQEKLPDLVIGLIHGKLKPKEKAKIMEDFVGNQINILVATTVIEVGIDVSNASVMVIEHSERMGLSQLHQLRGRVGRGINCSTCVLLYRQPLSLVAKKRLNTMYRSIDGFDIARQDLLIRGPGELLGERQSGVPLLKFANLETDFNLILLAKELVKQLIKDQSNIATEHVNLWLSGQSFYLRA